MATQSEYAAHRGVSNNTISKWKRRGLLVFDADGGVDIEKSDEFVANHGGRLSVLPFNPEVPGEGAGVTITPLMYADPATWTKSEAERVKLHFEAKLLELKFERESGEVADIDDVVVTIATEYALVRNKVATLGERLAQRLVAATSAEAVKDLVDAEVVAVLTELMSAAPGSTDFEELRASVMRRFTPATTGQAA